MSKPKNMRLYIRTKQAIKREYKTKGKAWPSVIGSVELSRRYKALGGKYIGKKPVSSGLTRWFQEKWINICKYPNKQFCGRTNMKNKYPKCRPSKRVSKETPMTVDEIIKKYGEGHLKRLCNDKRRHGLPKGGKATRRSLLP